MMLGMVGTGMAGTAMVGLGIGRGVRSDQRSQLTCVLSHGCRHSSTTVRCTLLHSPCRSPCRLYHPPYISLLHPRHTLYSLHSCTSFHGTGPTSATYCSNISCSSIRSINIFVISSFFICVVGGIFCSLDPHSFTICLLSFF